MSYPKWSLLPVEFQYLVRALEVASSPDYVNGSEHCDTLGAEDIGVLADARTQLVRRNDGLKLMNWLRTEKKSPAS